MEENQQDEQQQNLDLSQQSIDSNNWTDADDWDTSDMEEIARKLNSLQAQINTLNQANTAQDEKITAQNTEIEEQKRVIYEQKLKMNDQASHILQLLNRGGGGPNASPLALNAAVRKAVKDLEKYTPKNISSFILGVKIVIEEFKAVPDS